MPPQLPLGEHLNLIADIPITTRPGRHDDVDAVPVYRIACAFSPKEITVERQLELLDGFQFQRRMQIDLIGRTDLPMLAGVLVHCRALVTNDSGAMHLAAALGRDVTAVFA